MAVGDNENTIGETHSRLDLKLPGRQEQLVERIAALHKPTVMIMVNGRPVTINFASKNIPAILETWYLGEYTGDAIADVLFGNVNPGGKMPLTVYASEDQVPSQDEYDVTKGFTYMYLNGKPLFPFGHGLSYTKFKYSNLKISDKSIPPSGKITVRVNVKNTGKRTKHYFII